MTHRHTVLLVEDDDDVRVALTTVLTAEALDVVAVDNGKAALAALATMAAPCLVLTDLMMPTMNGWDFIEAFEKEPRFDAVPVAIMTAVHVQSIPKRAAFVLRKPLQPAALGQVLRRTCHTASTR